MNRGFTGKGRKILHRTGACVCDKKAFTALEGRGYGLCVLGMPGPCEHGAPYGHQMSAVFAGGGSHDVAGSEAEQSASSFA